MSDLSITSERILRQMLQEQRRTNALLEQLLLMMMEDEGEEGLPKTSGYLNG
jgi:hypothetical protein